MKILLITEFFPAGNGLKFSGGVEARTYYVGKYLAQKHKVYVISTRQPGSKKNEKINNINVIRVGPVLNYTASSHKNILKLVQFIKAAIKEGKKIQPDIVDGGNFLSHFIAKQIASGNKVPLVYWYPDVFIGQWLSTSGLFAGIAGYTIEKINLLRKPDLFISISNVTKAKLTKNGIPKKMIQVIPCGIEPKEFKFKTNKSKWQTIICVSRLVKYKRIEDLIWAFATIRKKNKDVKLIIVGRGPTKAKLVKLQLMLNIKNFVHFYQNLKRKDLIKLLKSSHVFCLPSEVEGFGISVIEAAAAGVPYVASNIPVLQEVTKKSKGGLLFKVKNIADLSLQLERLLNNKELYIKKTQETKELTNYYDWFKVALETEKAYKNLVK